MKTSSSFFFHTALALTQIRDELYRLMGMWDEDEVVTNVPLSCVRGGPTTLPRTEAISELRWAVRGDPPLKIQEAWRYETLATIHSSSVQREQSEPTQRLTATYIRTHSSTWPPALNDLMATEDSSTAENAAISLYLWRH